MNSQIVLDACGAALSQPIARKMLELMEAANASPDEIELHPAQLCAWEEYGLIVTATIRHEVTYDFDFNSKTTKTMAGIPITESLAVPLNEIAFKCDDVTVGKIQNLHIPKGWTTKCQSQ